MEQSRNRKDPDPAALACYGLLRPNTHEMRLRFVEGRPKPSWNGLALGKEGKKALLLVWDNASWHVSAMVNEWIRQHNLTAKREGGVRVLSCLLPIKSPWLNPIESHWVHGKRAIVEPDRKLAAQETEQQETEQRVCDYFPCPILDHIVITKQVS